MEVSTLRSSLAAILAVGDLAEEARKHQQIAAVHASVQAELDIFLGKVQQIIRDDDLQVAPDTQEFVTSWFQRLQTVSHEEVAALVEEEAPGLFQRRRSVSLRDEEGELLRIVGWNILAPVWAHPGWYPCVDSSTLDTEKRMPLLLHFIRSHGADILLLNEVQDVVHAALATELCDEFEVMPLACHAPELWGDNLLEGASGAPNGNAMLVRKGLARELVQDSIRLSDDGNTGVILRGVLAASGVRFLACVTHLDTEESSLRATQASACLAAIGEFLQGGELVIWGGDFNTSRDAPELQALFDAGLVPATRADGSSNYGSACYGYIDVPIDHVFVRGPAKIISHIECDPWVKDNTCEGGAKDDVIGPRTQWMLSNYGSDHMPVGCTIEVHKESPKA